MSEMKTFQLGSQPGIKRDGTNFDSREYTSGVWTRFNRGRPRKVRGYRQISNRVRNICRGIYLNTSNGQNMIISGHSQGLQQIVQSSAVGGASVTNYNLPSAFTSSDQYQWTIDAVEDSFGGGGLMLLAHPANSLTNIDDTTETNVFYGNIGDTSTPFGILEDWLYTPLGTQFTSVTATAGRLWGGTIEGNPLGLTAGPGRAITATYWPGGTDRPTSDTLNVAGTLAYFDTTVSPHVTVLSAGVFLGTRAVTNSPLGAGNTVTIVGNPFNATATPQDINVVFSTRTDKDIALGQPILPATMTYNGIVTTLTFTGDVPVGLLAGTPVWQANGSFVDVPVDGDTGLSFSTSWIAFQQTITPIVASGGVVQLHPFTFVYGNAGLIRNNDVSTTRDKLRVWTGGLANEVNVSSQKIVAAKPIRGGSQSPSGLFWALDSLIRVSFTGAPTGGAGAFRYDIVSAETTILSSKCVVEVDGQYFWLGADRFFLYNGVVQELPNDKNINYFYDNLNYSQRQKVWGLAIKRWGEIWWFYPHGESEECNNVIVYNYREKLWYDMGMAPGCLRTAGVAARVYQYPVMADWSTRVLTDGTNEYTVSSVWQHEVGVDRVAADGITAISSSIETSDLSWADGNPSQESPVTDPWSMRITRIEPDFNMKGRMFLTINGRKYPQDKDNVSRAYEFFPDTEKIDMREQRRLLRIEITSDEVGGDWEMGKMLIHAEPGDIRPSGG